MFTSSGLGTGFVKCICAILKITCIGIESEIFGSVDVIDHNFNFLFEHKEVFDTN